MSKPNLLGFASSVGIYRNKRVRDLHHLLHKEVPVKVEFSALAPMLFQVVMAYAGENQIDGNFEGYTNQDWSEIFITNHVQVTPAQAAIIIRDFHKVGLFVDDKIRSWAKYNRHLADYEGILKAKRKAGKLSAKKRELEAKEGLKTGKISPSENDQKRDEKGGENHSDSKQLWLIEKALESAKGKARKELLAQKEKLLSGSLGVDLSTPAPAPAPAPAKPRKQSARSFQNALLGSARTLVQDSPELLTEGMVKALVAAGEDVPEVARRKFSKLLSELGGNRNPVPG